ncbi:MAG TPA: hypothetical protein PKX62_16490 [Spirochaetota bacterium]|nr:hypothetical protein [Spirochaetota bacterium]HRS78494.1 hypothetical protein [Spirochaetota bacterium]
MKTYKSVYQEGEVTIKLLIMRVPEKETAYDKNMGKEYWIFQWSDGTFGADSLYSTQIEKVKRAKINTPPIKLKVKNSKQSSIDNAAMLNAMKGNSY